MKISEVNDGKLLESFLNANGDLSGAEFLASSIWAEINRQENLIMKIYGVFSDSGTLLAVGNIIVKPLLKVFSYVYSPRGPILALNLSPADQTLVWAKLTAFIRTAYQPILWRIEPNRPYQGTLPIKDSRPLQPVQTLFLDLTMPAVELLAAMHPKTRYNINLASKKGVTVRSANPLNKVDFELFWELMRQTGDRDGFNIHNRRHYEALVQATPANIKLLLAEKNHAVLAAGLFSFYGNKATYLHGASDHAARADMAPYLLQWTAINLAREKSCLYYDFYGIDEKKWPGVTRFKLGFGGRRFNYLGTFDIIFNPRLFSFYEIIRRRWVAWRHR
jgi:lipid II:glycine glycyltransferase (peptidoglycan interpeptide bridge formation enzyme)